MREILLKNNIKIIYKESHSELTSICISLDAGAGKEDKILGAAHAVEHMIYKATEKRNEKQINEELNETFGFQNAMTNYPYVIYYGTLLNEDFEKGIEIFSDILMNPVFPVEGFSEEMNVIKQELDEWDEENEQYCEDKLFINAFDERRIKYPIIGTKESLDKITIKDIKDFYEENYFPENTTITIVSHIKFEDAVRITEKYFGQWKSRYLKRNNAQKIINYEKPKKEIFKNLKKGIKICKAEIVVPIDNLTVREMLMLNLFNEHFGEGVNSLLYDALRTKQGLVYDVRTCISFENYIKLYKIIFSSAKKDCDYIIENIKDIINNLDSYEADNKKIKKIYKNIKLKKLFREEKSIIAAKELAVYDTMFGNYKIYEEQFDYDENINFKDVISFGKKLLQNLSIQIIE